MNRLMRAAAALCLLAAQVLGQAPREPESEEPWDRAVALQTRHVGTTQSATAFFVRAGEDIYLITAQHAAAETSGDSQLLYRAADGDSRWFVLAALFPPNRNPWQQFGNSDLAVARLDPRHDRDKALSDFGALAFPLDALADQLPKRTTPVTIVGFPLALGTTPPLSALVMPGHLVSRELTAKTKWGEQPVAYASPAVPAGTSGGPVFLAASTQEKTPTIVGMFIGYDGDDSGGKLARFVPSRLIREAVDAQRRRPEQPQTEAPWPEKSAPEKPAPEKPGSEG